MTQENPEDSSAWALEKRTLRENQVIMGIYGVKDEARNLTSLGFIIREGQASE